MRIAQTADGRYIKILSPQMQGVIGRLYKEIRDRKATETKQTEEFGSQKTKISILTSQVDAMSLRYSEMTDILRRMFPEDEPFAQIEKPLIVSGSVKAGTFVSTEKTAAPLSVESKTMVKNLNTEYLGGSKLSDVRFMMDAKIETHEESVAERFEEAREQADTKYAPIAHANAGGPGVHPYATQSIGGFLSPTDKLKLDRINFPGGVDMGFVEPAAPMMQQLWIDLN